MVGLKVLDVKKCMNQLLATDCFDRWQLAEAKIITYVSYVIDGHLTEEYMTGEEMEAEGLQQGECVPYGRVRPLCFDMIKGKRVPKNFRFVLQFPKQEAADFVGNLQGNFTPGDVANLTMNVSFSEGGLFVTTGYTLRMFSMDKSLEQEWDLKVMELFRKMEITVEKIT